MSAPMLKRWCYFGCPRHGLGHYLLDQRGESIKAGFGDPERYIEKWDGILPPHPKRSTELHQATVSRLPGLGISALAWWDRSGDSRSASNSALFAPHPEAGPEWLIEEGQRLFPWVFARLPQPLQLWRPRA